MSSRLNEFSAVVLVFTALVHALPLLGVFGASQLHKLYAVQTHDSAILLLLQHRAVMFAVLAAVLLYCALTPALRVPGLLVALACTASFVALALSGGDGMNHALKRVFWVDLILVGLSACALLMHVVSGLLSAKG